MPDIRGAGRDEVKRISGAGKTKANLEGFDWEKWIGKARKLKQKKEVKN